MNHAELLRQIEAAPLSAEAYRTARRFLDRTAPNTILLQLSYGEALACVDSTSLNTLKGQLGQMRRAGLLHYHRQNGSINVVWQLTPLATANPAQHVYFIRGVAGGPVKIGIATDTAKRLKELQANHPDTLQVLGVITMGGQRLERELHARFAQYRLYGEWFEWNAEIEAAIP